MVRGDDGRTSFQPVEGSEFELKADLVLLAMGFTGTPKGGIVDQAAVEVSPIGAVDTQPGRYETSREGIFACGDMRRGQSLVVWAIREGRECADAVHAFLAAERR